MLLHAERLCHPGPRLLGRHHGGNAPKKMGDPRRDRPMGLFLNRCKYVLYRSKHRCGWWGVHQFPFYLERLIPYSSRYEYAPLVNASTVNLSYAMVYPPPSVQ